MVLQSAFRKLRHIPPQSREILPLQDHHFQLSTLFPPEIPTLPTTECLIKHQKAEKYVAPAALRPAHRHRRPACIPFQAFTMPCHATAPAKKDHAQHYR